MQLFIWQGPDPTSTLAFGEEDGGVLRDYTDGMIVVIADTLEEAHDVFLKEWRKSYSKDPSHIPEYPKEPTEVVDIHMPQPQAWWVHGGA